MAKLMQLLADRQANTCPAPLSWYVCRANSFTGCCSVDPCDRSGCPDVESPSSTPTPDPVPSSTSSSDENDVVTVTVVPSSTTRTSSVSVTITTRDSAAAASSSSTTSDRSTLTTITSASPSRAASTSTSSSPASTSDSPVTGVISDNSSDSAGKTAIIAGTVAGVTGFMILLVIFWLLWRRKNKRDEERKQQRFQSTGSDERDFPNSSDVTEASGSMEKSWRKSGTDIFAELGGRFRSQLQKQHPARSTQTHNHPACLIPGGPGGNRPSIARRQESEGNIVPNLDSTPIMPSTELESTPPPCELSGEEKRQHQEQQQRHAQDRNQDQDGSGSVYLFRPASTTMRGTMDGLTERDGHVMSWAEYDTRSTPSITQAQKNKKGGGMQVSPLLEDDRWIDPNPNSGNVPVSPELGR